MSKSNRRMSFAGFSEAEIPPGLRDSFARLEQETGVGLTEEQQREIHQDALEEVRTLGVLMYLTAALTPEDDPDNDELLSFRIVERFREDLDKFIGQHRQDRENLRNALALAKLVGANHAIVETPTGIKSFTRKGHNGNDHDHDKD